MARKLNNPDMPTMAYRYDVRIIGDLPQEVWHTGKAMARIYDICVACHDAARTAYPRDCADQEARKAVLNHLLGNKSGSGLYAWAQTYKGRLRCEYYYSPHKRFLDAQAKFKKGQGGAPKRKGRLEKVIFPMSWGNFSEPVEWITSDSENRVYMRAAEGPTRGHFMVGESVVPFEIVMDRPLPEGALIKGIALSGFHERPFEWKWSLIFSLQVPPHRPLPKTGRVAGLDLGWRDMGDYVRIGMLADSAGGFWELCLPYDLSRNQDRKFIKRLEAQGCIDRPMLRDIRLIRDVQRKMDDHLEACKIDLAGVDKTAWPDEARAIMAGVVKMRAGGLRRLRRALFAFGISYEFFEDWHFEYETTLRRYRAAQIDWIAARDYLYRLIAAWIADNYDTVAWENLKLKPMAEAAGKRKKARKEKHEETGEWEERTVDERILEASQKRRQWACLHKLRGYIQEGMTKRGRDLQPHPAAYSSQVCDDCGQHIAPGQELMRECVERHIEDQDVTAGLYYLRIARDFLRAVAGVSASVNHSQLLKVIRRVSPMNAA